MVRFILWFLFPICSLLASLNEVSQVLDQAMIINLRRHPQRFEETKNLMQKAGFTNVQRFDAIDGFFTEEAFFKALNIYTGSPGQKGCAASHLLVWEDFLLSSDKECLFVAEDDMLPHSDFAKLFPLYWKQTPKDFDLIMVGNQMSANPSMPLIIPEPSFCLHAYIISKKGARKLLDAYKTIRKDDTNMHIIDIFLINVMCGRLPIPDPLIYYCYNGTHYKDNVNTANGAIWKDRDTGICFQNTNLGSSIHGVSIVEEVVSKK